jgi:hypothetical protein
MRSLFRYLWRNRPFVWQPDLDLSDSHIRVALMPYSMN